MKIGICERGWARPSTSSASLIDELCSMAAEIERLGIHKLWLTEHHLADYAWALPDLLIPVIATATRQLMVGIGGLLVASRNPYRTALDMSLLHALLGERLEIGIGRATASINHRCLSGDAEPSGSKELTAHYLARLSTLLSCFGLPVSRTAFDSPTAAAAIRASSTDSVDSRQLDGVDDGGGAVGPAIRLHRCSRRPRNRRPLSSGHSTRSVAVAPASVGLAVVEAGAFYVAVAADADAEVAVAIRSDQARVSEAGRAVLAAMA